MSRLLLLGNLTYCSSSRCPRHQGSQSTEFHALRCGGQRDDISAGLKSSSSVLRAEVRSSTPSFLLPTFISTLPSSDSLSDSDLSVHFPFPVLISRSILNPCLAPPVSGHWTPSFTQACFHQRHNFIYGHHVFRAGSHARQEEGPPAVRFI